jgi:pyruvate dehydrogenase E2 component (dihydrolipoamide acetyltransferase)
VNTDIIMPFLSETMESGTIVEWLKKPGDPVAIGEGIAEIATDKVEVTYESDASGILLELLAAEGDDVPCGQVIARLGPTT